MDIAKQNKVQPQRVDSKTPESAPPQNQPSVTDYGALNVQFRQAPQRMSSSQMLQLQRIVGNRAVSHAVDGKRQAGGSIQPKPAVNLTEGNMAKPEGAAWETSSGEPQSVQEQAKSVDGLTNPPIHQPFSAIQPSESNGVVQAKFEPASISSKAHLREEGSWYTKIGEDINQGDSILVDDSPDREKKNFFSRWKPALNVRPNAEGDAIADNATGYIRGSKVRFRGAPSYQQMMAGKIRDILVYQEDRNPDLQGHLAKEEHIKFLMEKAIYFDSWGKTGMPTFLAGYRSLPNRLGRIREGAEFVAQTLMHWKNFLYPQHPEQVQISRVKFKESDLHERGLGVLDVTFTKPAGQGAEQWRDEAEVNVMLKPEDKTLEQNLLGDKPDSVANQINRIVGLTDPNRALATIKIATDEHYGAMIEKIRGTRAKDLNPQGDRPVDKDFHETLVFAFLAGIDDLHGENVFYVGNKPYLIDADNVMLYHQMVKERAGGTAQEGFSKFNKPETQKHIEDMKNLENSSGSLIMDTLLNHPVQREQIFEVLKQAIMGKHGRVVPIFSGNWGLILQGYAAASPEDRNLEVRDRAKEKWMVRREWNQVGGDPGLFGCTFENQTNPFYAEEAEKQQIKSDLDKGVIPFYNYDYTTGHVSHNGIHIYNGQTLEQAMSRLYNKLELLAAQKDLAIHELEEPRGGEEYQEREEMMSDRRGQEEF
jgi:hypothetical protein